MVRGLVPPPANIHALRSVYLSHLKNQFGELDFRGIVQVHIGEGEVGLSQEDLLNSTGTCSESRTSLVTAFGEGLH